MGLVSTSALFAERTATSAAKGRGGRADEGRGPQGRESGWRRKCASIFVFTQAAGYFFFGDCCGFLPEFFALRFCPERRSGGAETSGDRPISWSLSSRLRSRAVRPSHPPPGRARQTRAAGPQGRRAFPDRRKTTSIMAVSRPKSPRKRSAAGSNFVALVLQDTSCFPMPRIRRPPKHTQQ